MFDETSSVDVAETVDTAESTDGVGSDSQEVEVASPGLAVPETTAEGAETETADEQPVTAQPEANQHEENERWKARRLQAEQRGYDRAIAARNAELDKWAVDLYGSIVNPVTGKNISNFAEYQQALAAQREARRNKDIAEKASRGEDVSALIEEAVKSSPAYIEANKVIEQQKRDAEMAEQQAKVIADVELIKKLDASIKTTDDLQQIPEFAQVDELWKSGMSLYEAYIRACGERILKNASQTAQNAARQQTINEVKGKSHLTTAPKATAVNEKPTIPADKLQFYRDEFPGKTDAQLNEMWARTH